MLRRQRLAALAGVVSLVAALQLAPSTGALPESSPRGATIAFEDIVIDPPVFSPNGDGRKDNVAIRYRLVDSTIVTITVQPRNSAEVVDVVKDSLLELPRSYSTTWDGKYTNGATVPDGEYTIAFRGTTVRGVPLANDRIVRVDTTVPAITGLTITPPVDTTRAAASANVQFRVTVNNTDLGDSLAIAVRTGPNRPVREVLEHLQLLLGDGTYPAECDSCFDAVKFADGWHRVRVRVADLAGNVTTRVDSLDRDVLGPKPSLTHPTVVGGAFAVTHADSIVGKAFDRHGVARMELRVGAPVDTTVILPQTISGPDTLFFMTPLGFLGDVEGRYPMVLRGRDPFGVRDSLAFTYEIDRTGPPQPLLSPRPGLVTESPALEVRLAVDSLQTYRVQRTGGASGSDTKNTDGRSSVTFSIALTPRVNHLAFRGLDRAGNSSPPETLTVVYETTFGLIVPERFRAGNVIQVATGDTPGSGVEIRIYATDGSTVQLFEDPASRSLYSFPWNLVNDDGNRVKNGAYLVRAELRTASGTQRQQKLIAVLE